MLNESLQSANILAPVLLSICAVIALVVSDWRDFRPGRYLFKPLAAMAFVWLALSLGAVGTSYGQWLLVGLLCCLAGDLLLMADRENFFLAGLIAFLCGHLFYAVAFLQLPQNAFAMALTAVPAVILLILALRWLMPHVDQTMKLPVAVYTLVITSMLVCAGNSAGLGAAPLIISGAWGFAISDLAVARRQFVNPSRWNGLWGTPLYFCSQMLLACSVALA